jgi:hypothetical protein
MPSGHATDAPVKLPGRRIDIIADAFASFDPEHTGKASFKDIAARFDVMQHPLVQDAQMAPSKATKILFDNFQECANRNDGFITWDEFFNFHAKISVEVNARREADKDAFFVNLVTSIWRLEQATLAGTKIVPVTLEMPSGLAATRNMDLIWAAEDGHLCGYKGVVTPTFARLSLPEQLRGNFALPQELLQASVKYLPIQSAVQPAYDFVWREGEDKPFVGLKGIIAANVDYALIPPFLQQFILTPKESAALKVQFLATSEKPPNPFYKKSSQSIGVNANEFSLRVNMLKKQLHEGTLRGTVFAGRTGSFTKQFAGGMPVTSGFNM